MLLDFNKDFSIRSIQKYTLWHNAWEVYIGRFENPQSDGLFLYDPSSGEARVMSFLPNLQISNYQEIHNLQGNWEVHIGDFNGSGRAQVLLYDPSSGEAQFLTFANDLSLSHQTSLPDLGKNLVLYVGHFGMHTLSVMLYNPQAAKSTFIAFDASLKIAHRYTIKSWDQQWQVLIGAFVNRSRCLAKHTCTSGDDILVLNRQTGQLQQYVFSFPSQHAQGKDSSQPLLSINTTPFNLLTTLSTSIRNEELY